MAIIINQPPDGMRVTVDVKGGGSASGQLVFNKSFSRQWSGRFNKMQAYIDQEVLKFCSARVPFLTGYLQNSGIIGTTVGSGLVTYVAKYARYQYYNTPTTRPYDSLRGSQWFERGKIAERARILATVIKMGN